MLGSIFTEHLLPVRQCVRCGKGTPDDLPTVIDAASGTAGIGALLVHLFVWVCDLEVGPTESVPLTGGQT